MTENQRVGIVTGAAAASAGRSCGACWWRVFGWPVLTVIANHWRRRLSGSSPMLLAKSPVGVFSQSIGIQPWRRKKPPRQPVHRCPG